VVNGGFSRVRESYDSVADISGPLKPRQGANNVHGGPWRNADVGQGT